MPPNSTRTCSAIACSRSGREDLYHALQGNKSSVRSANESWKLNRPKEGLYPHTCRFDQKGHWYTLRISNPLPIIDLNVRERTIRLPDGPGGSDCPRG